MRWKDIPGWEGSYQVSDTGLVRGLDRVVEYRDGRQCHIKGKIRRQTAKGRGYLGIHLTSPGREEQAYTHRLVLAAFVGVRAGSVQTRHLDGDQTNNRLENLCYGTAKENGEDRVSHGTSTKGETNPRSKLTEDDVRWVREQLSEGRTHQSVADSLDVSVGAITAINLGNTWGWLE